MGLESERTWQITNSHVQITDRCNFSCQHCCQQRRQKDMAYEDYCETLDWLGDTGIKHIVIFGGEVRLHPSLSNIVRETKRRGLRSSIYTNGFGMNNPENTVRIINNLADIGVDEIIISLDDGHRKYTKDTGIDIDYDFIDMLCKFNPTRDGINPKIQIFRAGTGNYVIPIGRAKNTPWEKRFSDKDLHLIGPGLLSEQVREEIKEEFTNWIGTSSFSHSCYCAPTRFIRNRKDSLVMGNKHNWYPIINTDKTINLCPFDILPRIGDVDNMSAGEVYNKAASSMLYNTLATEGPQGVARLVWDISDKKLKKIFVERTPCGLCEDLSSGNLKDLQNMMETKKQ